MSDKSSKSNIAAHRHFTNKQSGVFFIIPLFVAAAFAGLMFYVAVISSEKARGHFNARKFNEAVKTVGKISFGQDNPALRIFSSPTPTPLPTPTPTRSLLKTMDYYEIGYPISAFFLLCNGTWLFPLLFGKLPQRNPLDLTDLTRRSLLVMICSFIFSPAFLILYIWSLRIGLIQ